VNEESDYRVGWGSKHVNGKRTIAPGTRKIDRLSMVESGRRNNGGYGARIEIRPPVRIRGSLSIRVDVAEGSLAGVIYYFTRARWATKFFRGCSPNVTDKNEKRRTIRVGE